MRQNNIYISHRFEQRKGPSLCSIYALYPIPIYIVSIYSSKESRCIACDSSEPLSTSRGCVGFAFDGNKKVSAGNGGVHIKWNYNNRRPLTARCFISVCVLGFGTQCLEHLTDRSVDQLFAHLFTEADHYRLYGVQSLCWKNVHQRKRDTDFAAVLSDCGEWRGA